MAYDAILILGGGVRDGGALPPWAAARYNLALELETGEPLVCLSAGTTHRPPPLENGFPVLESVAGARFLMQKGVESARIRIENASFDTIGNAYFAKTMHVDPAGWRRLLVITSEFHMPRTRVIFDWVFGFEHGKYELSYAASPNHGMSEQNVQKRESKEAEALSFLAGHRQRLSSLRELHSWLFTEHAAYSAQGRWKLEASKDPFVLESY